MTQRVPGRCDGTRSSSDRPSPVERSGQSTWPWPRPSWVASQAGEGDDGRHGLRASRGPRRAHDPCRSGPDQEHEHEPGGAASQVSTRSTTSATRPAAPSRPAAASRAAPVKRRRPQRPREEEQVGRPGHDGGPALVVGEELGPGAGQRGSSTTAASTRPPTARPASTSTPRPMDPGPPPVRSSRSPVPVVARPICVGSPLPAEGIPVSRASGGHRPFDSPAPGCAVDPHSEYGWSVAAARLA